MDIVFVLILLGSIIYNVRPDYDGFDLVCYMGIALEFSNNDLNEVHKEVYRELQAAAPEKIYKKYTDGTHWYSRYYEDVNQYKEVLNYHRAKPLYNLLVLLLYSLGVSLAFSTIIPGIAGVCILMIILFAWLSDYIKRPYVYLLAGALLFLPVNFYLVTGSPVDGLSNMLLLGSLYVLATGKKTAFLIPLLVLAVLCRVDNFIFVSVLCYFRFFKDSKVPYILVFATLLGILSVLAIPVLLGNPPDWMMQFSFLGSFSNYVDHLSGLFTYQFRQTYFVFYFVLWLLLSTYGDSYTRLLLKIIGITFLVHLILFPSVEERFLVAFNYTILILFIRHMGSFTNIKWLRPMSEHTTLKKSA